MRVWLRLIMCVCVCVCVVVSFPDPNNPSADCFQYSQYFCISCREGGSGDLFGGNADLRLECRRTQLLVNYHIFTVNIFCCFRSPFRSMHANPNKRSDRRHYDVRKGESDIKTRARDVNQ